MIEDLQEALHLFEKQTHMRKLKDLYLKGLFVAAIYQGDTEEYIVTFKRDWYHSFGHPFPHTPDRGYGQITSLQLLEYGKLASIKYLVAVMPQGVAYRIEIEEFLKYYEVYDTDVSTTPGHNHLIGEVASPIRLWKRMYPK